MKRIGIVALLCAGFASGCLSMKPTVNQAAYMNGRIYFTANPPFATSVYRCEINESGDELICRPATVVK